MKVVCCKNCGAKYQLDDNDDITTFECSSCAGDLEFIEDYDDGNIKTQHQFDDPFTYTDSYIVQCEDCGLKYKIKSTDSIIDYECDSCGGSLRYLDEELNKELDEYLKERKDEIKTIRRESENYEETSDELTKEHTDISIKSFTNRIENFFSEENMQQIAEEEKREKELEEEKNAKTARTTIPKSVLSQFGREFAVPKTNDYAVMKNFLKDEFAKSLEEYYPKRIEPEHKSFLDKISIKEPDNGEVSLVSYEENEKDEEEDKIEFNISDLTYNHYILIAGAIIFLISIIEILTSNAGIGIVALLFGVIGISYGLYSTRSDENEKEKGEHKRIIRQHLLSLPEDYYVFYNVKIPISSSSINHLVVGPTGIYAILSKKYNPQNSFENNNDSINLNISNDENKIEKVALTGMRRFRYTTKQAKFSKDNDIKQKALTLGEDLINFLNDNDIKNCFVEPLVGFVNNDVVVINMPLTDEDLFIDELLNQIQNTVTKLDPLTIDKCAVLINRYSADCSAEI